MGFTIISYADLLTWIFNTQLFMKHLCLHVLKIFKCPKDMLAPPIYINGTNFNHLY